MADFFDPATVTPALTQRFAAVIGRLEAAAPDLEAKYGTRTGHSDPVPAASPAPAAAPTSAPTAAPTATSAVAAPDSMPSPRTARSILNRERKPLPSPRSARLSSFGQKHTEGGLSATNTDAETEQRTQVLIAFDELSDGKISEYFRLSAELGSPFLEQAELVRVAYVAQRRLLKITPHTREPGPKILKQLLEATEASIRAVLKAGEVQEEEYMIALGGVAEGSKALAWVSLGMCWRSEQKRNPFEYVDGCIKAAKHEWFDGIFEDPAVAEGNTRALKKVEWANSYLDALRELLCYVEKFHKEEMAWGAVTNKSRSMTFWSNAIAQTAPGEGDADKYEYSTKLGIPVTK